MVFYLWGDVIITYNYFESEMSLHWKLKLNLTNYPYELFSKEREVINILNKKKNYDHTVNVSNFFLIEIIISFCKNKVLYLYKYFRSLKEKSCNLKINM